MDKVQALKKTALFGKLDMAALKALAARSIEKHLKKDENLFMAGQKAEGLFIIVKGAIRAYRSNAEGREQTIHIERGGAAIAELPLYDDLPYPSSAAAEEPTDLLYIAKADVHSFLMAHPIIALEALKILAGRLRKTAGLVEMLALKEVDQRLAAFLLQEARVRGTPKPAGIEITVPPYPQIASRLGSVREVVSRAMTKLTKEGLVKPLGKKKFLIPSKAKLHTRVDRSTK